MTPTDFENRYNISAKRLRSYLRGRWPHEQWDRWHLTTEMVEDACEHFQVGGFRNLPPARPRRKAVQFEFRDPETERAVSLTNEELWYEHFRAEYKPDSVRVLLLAESPPDPGSGDRRFFYNSRLTAHDNLFRSVALAAYGLDKEALQRTPKVETLRRLQADGFFLIDAVGYPINHMEPGARQHAIQEAVPDLIERCRQLAPADGVFICAKPVYKAVTHLLRQANITILNKSPAPFPLGNTRAEFVRLWRRDIPTREAA